MDTASLLLFVPACFALNMAPGPNNLLSIHHAARHGFRRACLGGVGRLVAFAGMIALASAGLAVVLQTGEVVFWVIKGVGAGYLLVLALQLWRAPAEAVEVEVEVEVDMVGGARGWDLVKREFFVAASNPKAILIFTAFLPQFIDPSRPASGQFAVLGAWFLVLECVAMGLYACLGLHMQRLLGRPESKRLFNRGCASLLGMAGVGLLLVRQS